MYRWKRLHAAVLAVLLVVLPAQAGYAYTEGTLLKEGMRSDEVAELQRDLKSLGLFEDAPTGYFGSITVSKVMNFQKRNNLAADGIAGNQTLKLLKEQVKRSPGISRGEVTRGVIPQKSNIVLLPWFEKVSKIFKIGDFARVTDVDTGISFTVKRTFGVNHADVETVTAEDTALLKKIAGGEWNWTRRAAIVELDGYKLASSITARPHQGRDDKPARAIVENLSGGFGTGKNLDTIKGNKMDGHFDIFFLNSRTHGTDRIDEKHQQMVKKAYESGEN